MAVTPEQKILFSASPNICSLSNIAHTSDALRLTPAAIMKLFAIATTFAAAASAVAIPEAGAEAAAAAADYDPCSGLTGSPVCCGTSVDGILDLDCTARK